jgi:hypothetical protein
LSSFPDKESDIVVFSDLDPFLHEFEARIVDLKSLRWEFDHALLNIVVVNDRWLLLLQHLEVTKNLSCKTSSLHLVDDGVLGLSLEVHEVAVHRDALGINE